GTLAGDRRFVRVLQLLGEHPLARVRRAVEACQLEHLTSAEAGIQRRRSLALIEATSRDPSASISEPAAATGVSVPLPDLSRFDRLLNGVASEDESSAEAQTMQCRECSPAGRINFDEFLGDPRSRDDST